MFRTLLKVLLLVGVIVALAWFLVGERVLSRGKTAVQRSGEARGAAVDSTE